MMKKALSLLLALALILSLGAAFAYAPKVISGDTLELTIYHTNDTHGRTVNRTLNADAVALAKIAGKVEADRAAGKNVLLLDAGDTFHGDINANLFSGYTVVKVLNEAGYDAMAPGNHDFNYGSERLLKLASYARFDVLAANVTKDGAPLLDDCVIKKIDGVRIGIFGLATPETVYKSHPSNTAGLTFEDEIETAAAYVKKLQAMGAQYIICLGHIGIDGSTEVISEKIMESVDGIDLFIDGHSHSVIDGGKEVGGGLLVSTGEYLNNVGVVQVSIKDGVATTTAKLVNKEGAAAWPEKQSINEMCDYYDKLVSDKLNVVIGKTEEDLVGEREFVRTRQTNLGSLITDALRSATGANIALQNGGGIRVSIPKGDITYANIKAVLPFNNLGVVKKYTGAAILEALELSVSAYPDASGGFLHVSGMTFSFDPAKEAGSRVSDVLVGGEPLDLEKEYTVALNDFTAAGGDNYTMLGGGALLAERPSLDALVSDYIIENGPAYEPGERITVIQ